MAVATLLAATQPYDTDTITVRASKGVKLLTLPRLASDDSVPFYSSHMHPTRQSVLAEACNAVNPIPLLSVAGVMISPPGAATHRNVARWFSGTSNS